MKRKVIQIAESTQLVSLPRKWALKHNLKKGDEVDVQEEGNRIVVSTDKGFEVEKAEIDVSDLDPAVLRFINALYKKGVDEITVRFSDPEHLSIIQKMLNEDVIGFEIINQEKNYCVLKAVARGYEKEFDSVLRRTFLVLKSMTKGAVEAMQNADASNINNIRNLETLNNRSTGFCRRIINKGEFKDFKNITFMYCTVEELEKVADQYKYLCDYFLRSEKNIKNIPEKCIKIYQNLDRLFEEFYECFYKFERKRIIEAFKKRKELVNQCHEIFNKGNAQETTLAHYAVAITQMIANMLSFKIEMEI